MPQDTVLVAVPPQQLHTLQGRKVTPAHLAYRLGREGRLLRADAPLPRGGLMVVADGDYDGLTSPLPLCGEVLRECRSRCFSGAVLDFERRLPPTQALAARLDRLFSQQGLTLYVPEAYGDFAPGARVVIPSALSGGSLEQRLTQAAERFGRDRVVLALQRCAEDFLLPAPTGCGRPLSAQELEQLRGQLAPCVFFSRELCARYFTYMGRDNSAHFVLFDDGETLRCKVELARRCGVTVFLALWEDMPQLAFPPAPATGASR